MTDVNVVDRVEYLPPKEDFVLPSKSKFKKMQSEMMKILGCMEKVEEHHICMTETKRDMRTADDIDGKRSNDLMQKTYKSETDGNDLFMSFMDAYNCIFSESTSSVLKPCSAVGGILIGASKISYL